jgi:phosphoglycolate phosphatase
MIPICLFDIDGTLIHAAGAGRRSLDRALAKHYGRPSMLDGMRIDGMTDRLIVREALAALGQPFDVARCDAVLETYIANLAEEIRSPNYRVLPGVPAVLEQLQARRACFGLGTGNIAAGARIKLGRGDLARFFAWDAPNFVAGFGEDGEAREDMLRAAITRASAVLGRPVAPNEVLVIGDTPRDVESAARVGCQMLAVATGQHSVDVLRACGAPTVVESLESPAALEILLP